MSEAIIQFVLLGAFSGFAAGLLGIGGGLIIVPVLLYLLAPSIDQSILMHTAIGTALAAIVFTSISSLYAHHRHGAILWRNFVKLTPTILLGSYSGAILAKYLSFDFLRIFFAFSHKTYISLKEVSWGCSPFFSSSVSIKSNLFLNL